MDKNKGRTWRERVEQVLKWRVSGVSQSAYSRTIGVHPTTFGHWVRLAGERADRHIKRTTLAYGDEDVGVGVKLAKHNDKAVSIVPLIMQPQIMQPQIMQPQVVSIAQAGLGNAGERLDSHALSGPTYTTQTMTLQGRNGWQLRFELPVSTNTDTVNAARVNANDTAWVVALLSALERPC
jgi:hypothetical protein